MRNALEIGFWLFVYLASLAIIFSQEFTVKVNDIPYRITLD